MLKLSTAYLLVLLAAPAGAFAQVCPGATLSGVVRDTTGALLPGAKVSLDGGTPRTAGADARVSFPCVTNGTHELTASLPGFAPTEMHVSEPGAAELSFRLVPSTEASVTVDADDSDMQVPAPGGTNGLAIAGKQLQSLADDPDDLLRELQQLAAISGGNPSSATISVDGFQDSAQLPPKDSIAFINVAPDMFSAEYREPPFGGGRVEVYTKPGAKTYHGSLFGTNSSSWMNARDPFTDTTGTIGKQRYGFDLSGPVRKQGSNFSLNLEHRSIDETVGVSATVPGANGVGVVTTDTVPIPQRLWIGQARVDWQLGPKNIAFVSFSANVNHQQNLGVGGQTLREAGYDSGTTDYTVRASNVTTFSPTLVHESRASFEHNGAVIVPASNGPSLQVAGFFTGGGATIGNERDSHSRTEFDDDIILNTKKQLIKTGVQLLYFRRNFILPTYFNGAYIFSGYGDGTAASPAVSPLQQYEQAEAGTHTATEFNNVSGNPNVIISQVRLAAFYQDNVKLSPKWTVFYGFRYSLETDPGAYNGLAPRGGVSFTPDKKATWVLKAHFGVFDDQYASNDAQESQREDGIQRITSLIYNPVFGSPFTGATPIFAKRVQAPGLNFGQKVFGEFNVSKDLPFGFNINGQEVLLRDLTDARTVNINQPLTPDPYGPRPFGPNVNILQLRDDGTGQGHGEFVSLSNQRLKHVQFFVGSVHINIRENTDASDFDQPQSAYTDAGEQAHVTQQSSWQTFGNVNVSLPWKLALSGNGYGNGGQPFNILTGMDNNGDGDFNDRPQFAFVGSMRNGTTLFNTPFGVLTNNGAIVNGIPVAPIVRNPGRLPWSFHLDANLQRAFKLKTKAAGHEQTITANVRSANFLNHTNVTSEGNVLGSPQFLVPIAADTARRVEVGLRYSF